jgi:sulfide:quinone oxidoreductase
MRPLRSSRTPARVVIAGGGFAALETLLALRSLAGDRVAVTLVTPEPLFLYRPSATAEVFGTGPPQAYDLRAIADDLGARIHRVRLESVGSETKYVRLSSGARLSYDFLVLAVGARARSTVSGALTFRDQRDVPLFRLMLEDLRAGRVRRLVFALPPGFTWPLPLYELALLSSTYAAGHGVDAEITVVSPEQRPLAAFGAQASPLVESVFKQRGVQFVGSAAARSVERGGSLALRSGVLIEADRVVAVPQLRGQWITGVPASWWGFVPTDAAGRVDDLPGVYAAGDVTSFPIKQAGLATQQADRIASQIAAEVGVAAAGSAERQILQARLLGGDNPLFLRTELDTEGRTAGVTLVREEPPGGAKVLARHLTEYLDAHQQLGGASLAVA